MPAIETSYPLSPLQQGMLYHALSAPGSGVDIEQMVCTLREEVDAAKLRAAWEQVTARHAILRTAFRWEETPVQEIYAGAEAPFAVVDFSTRDAGEQGREFATWLREDRRRGFEMNVAPLLRLTLFTFSSAESRLVWTFHHALLDGRSFPIVLREVFAFYDCAAPRGPDGASPPPGRAGILPAVSGILSETSDVVGQSNVSRRPGGSGRIPEPAGETPALPGDTPAPHPYRDYIVWLQTLNPSASEPYWRERLAGFLAPTPIVVDRLPACVTESSQGDAEVRIPAQLTATLRDLAAENGFTLNTLVQGAWALLLSRYNRLDDVVFGATRACRRSTIAGAEEMVGLFINTLPVRARIDPATPLLPWLRELRAQWVAMRPHEHTPLAAVQSWTDLPAGTTLFDSIVVFENYELNDALQAAGVTQNGRDFRLYEQTNFALTLAAYAGPGLLLRIEFDRQRFEPATIERLLGHLRVLLEGFASTPDARLGDFPLTSPAERDELIAAGVPAPPATAAPETTLHALFAAQVARTPDAVALTFQDDKLTYRELDTRAAQLALRLRESGAQRDRLVGLLMERGIDLIVGLVAILKAGAGYLPIDPGTPPARAAFMLADAQAPVLLTQHSLAARLPAHPARVLCIEDFSPAGALAEEPGSPDDLAYVIFTSGSTGRPKGVEITHRHVVRLFTSTQQWFGFGERDVWTMFHSVAFDFTVWEIWGALLHGGRLVIVPYAISRSPEAFHALLLRERVTILNQTPSAFRQLIAADAEISESAHLEQSVSSRAEFRERSDRNAAEGSLQLGTWAPPGRDPSTPLRSAQDDTVIEGLPPQRVPPVTASASATQPTTLNSQPSSLRLVIFGGEALEMRSLQPWFERHGDVQPQLVNMYGITETTVHVTYRPLRAGDTARGSVIGEPIPDLELHVLDEALRPAPIGVPGELHVGGAGLARGYLRRPDLTAERFIQSPFADHHSLSPRLYRTGDLARRIPDGDIEYLGRIDQQVQLRGFRVELGEIESALAAHGSVREACVIAREEAGAATRLIAYLVAKGAPPDVSTLREHLRRSLPDYMVPAAFVFLRAMPLTANGKLDKRALPEPEPARPEVAAQFVTPQTPAEQTLAAIWRKVLRLERVGIHDNFFELGGDSILSILIVSQARQAGLPLTPKHLFENQTIATLATAVPATAAAVVTEVETVTGEAPLTPIQRWFFEHDFSAKSHWNQSFIFETAGALDESVFSRAIDAVAQHHPAFRLRFRHEDAAWRQSHADDAGDFAAKIEGDPQASLDIHSGPLLRAVPLDQRRVLIVAHHLCIDGVSWRILMEDLQTACRQLLADRSVRLLSEATSFQRWARDLVAAAHAPRLAAELPHWLALTSFHPAPLPRDRAGENTEASARTITASLSSAETDALLQRLPAATRTRINDALLTALGQTLADWTGATSHLIELEGHGREEAAVAELLGTQAPGADLSRTIGWFTSIFPVRLDVPRERALFAIRDQLNAIPRRGLGYGLLRYLAGHAELRTSAEVLFNYLGQFEQMLAGTDLFRLSSEPTGAWHSPRARRTHTLEINCLVLGGRLEARWSFSENLHDAATIQRLADRFTAAIRTLLTEHAPASAEEDSYALSPMQQLFYTLEAAQPNAGFDQWHFALRGELDAARFHAAWRAVLRRHTILRTAFSADGSAAPRQTVLRAVDLPLHLEDWRAFDPAAQSEKLEAFLGADRERGFDLAKAPLTRLALLRLRDDAWRFVWSHHHLQIDGWSWPIVFRDAAALYAGRSLPPVRPYGDFIAWQQRRPAADDEAFWREKLRGFSRPTPLPRNTAFHAVRPAGFQPAAASQEARGPHGMEGHVPNVHESTLAISETASAALDDFARRHHITMNVAVQGAWALLLSRHSDERDVVFGASFAGRPADLSGVEHMVGHFVNNLPIRVKIEATTPLHEQLQRTQRELFALNEHQFTPLAQIQAWSELPWHARLFESLLVFQNYVIDDSALRFSEDAVFSDAVTPVRTNYPLTVVFEQGKMMRLTVIAAASRFSAQAAAELRDQFATLLSAMAEGGAATLGELLDLLPAPARAIPARQRASADFVAPRTATEGAIAALWQEAFGADRVGIRDNFFDLGGHSLLMVRVHAKLRDALKSDISIVRMFQYPTIESLARHLDGGREDSSALAAAQARAQKQKAALARQRTLVRK